MSRQKPGLRTSLRLARRHKFLVGIMVVLGLAAGGGYARFHPPLFTGTALILLPQNGQPAQSAAGASKTSSFVATQELIAQSSTVLSAALPHVRPVVSLTELDAAVAVASPSQDIISVSAQEKTAADAAATANAVAASYISYVGSDKSPGGKVAAQLLQSASSNTGTGRLKQIFNYGIYGVAGALVGALAGLGLAAAASRRDRRLRDRDAIANSIGISVLASFPVGHPLSAGEWTTLLEDYKPGALYALQLRNVIRQLGSAGDLGSGRGTGKWSFTVLSLSSDHRALALGPQLAVYAAAQGIPTALVIGPQQDATITPPLRNACAAPPASPAWPAHLRLIVADEDVDVPQDVTLAVVVAVVDGRNPKVPATMRTTATLLGISAGAATADQLARVAISAISDGREITGILVANPDSNDTTTGRLPQFGRPARRMATRVTGIMTEIRRLPRVGRCIRT
ncbi:MAG TPA: Wzz/FepE/Etk N-terminal domain-containing protein [Streptosporangiaceae bacterium]|nr:Wzz/FepE/Etk N-terminal domain-containing protein [Streptosporangiaceae bacterium]